MTKVQRGISCIIPHSKWPSILQRQSKDRALAVPSFSSRAPNLHSETPPPKTSTAVAFMSDRNKAPPFPRSIRRPRRNRTAAARASPAPWRRTAGKWKGKGRLRIPLSLPTRLGGQGPRERSAGSDPPARAGRGTAPVSPHGKRPCILVMRTKEPRLQAGRIRL